MANKDEISIVWDGLQEFSKELDGMTKELEKNLMEAMTEYLKLVEEGAKALVHYDEGELEQSLTTKGPRREGDRVVGEIGSNLTYAFRRHEEPYRYGVRDKYDNGVRTPNYYVYGRGRETLKKPKWRGQAPGRKYLENAVVLTEDDYEKIMAKALEKTLGGK
ncbi:HK97 gp10 family phage protein [Oceanobacillus sp. FSL W7-1281]|uniref:HK97 gp10 family phage protein n=1 Tax=Oceanobacillus sp. FSL W7-1281 TaxID=2921698 RepID=UPI0030D6CE04